jgi:hypothetical protein
MIIIIITIDNNDTTNSDFRFQILTLDSISAPCISDMTIYILLPILTLLKSCPESSANPFKTFPDLW